ncbi:MAG TPA: DNA alkylation repair protein [Acholeplasmataceae bacterium]|jgi:3-methyladenine DNA glycosylase AlkD|nr:DNA alkylation repair protein [Acholeplasmataceae bacterium]
MNEKINAFKLSSKAESVLSMINDNTKMGDLRKIAKEIKKDHVLAMDLWSTEKFLPRLLSILIMDNKLLSEDVINKLDKDMMNHPLYERNYLMDWLMGNQLTKSKKTVQIMESWQNSSLSLQRRAFWYYQARLRWTGKTFENTEQLLSAIEKNIIKEEPEVQWAMNLTAGWIGVYEEKYRNRCVKIGEETGLYKGEKVPKGCTPNYLPEFIRIEVNKRKK